MTDEVGDTNIRVQVNGTTFTGIFDVIASVVELTSPEFGTRSVEFGDEEPGIVAERTLRALAEEAMRNTDIPFLRDDGTVGAVVDDVVHQGLSRDQEDVSSSLRRQIVRRHRHGELLMDFARMAAEASEVETLLQLACTQMSRGVEVTHSDIMRYRSESGDLLMVAGIGWEPGLVGHSTSGTDLSSLPGRVLQTHQAATVADFPNDPELRYSALMRHHGIVAALAVPVAIDGTAWGVAQVASRKPRSFDLAEVHFLSTLANVLGQDLERRRLLQRVAETEASSAMALSQERMFLDELRHRSRNDIQLILTMLVMQKREQTDEGARRGLDDLMSRVAAVGLAHDQLAVSRGAGRVELANYIQALCGNLKQRRENIHVEAHLARVEISHERAVALGLIVNELVTNALKHAFPNGQSGTVHVEFELVGCDEGRLSVRDDGVGVGQLRPEGSGIELVRRFVQQVGGQMVADEPVQGTGFVIQFPLVT